MIGRIPQIEKQHDTDKISAYYSLAFPNFTYYLQTLTVTIGRRPIPSNNGAVADPSLVDVDLGPLKSVSRLHARIEYEEEDERFVLVVLGRNGAWVDGIWAASGSRVPLGARSQIQIASRTFHFVLPPPPEPDATSLSPPPSTARERSPSVDITSLSGGSSRQVSPVAPIPPPIASSSATPALSKLTKNSKKRKRPHVEQLPPEKMPPKPLATYGVMCYRAITSLGGKATLQEVIQWMIDNYEWYKLNIGGPWENSVRHNLSSNKAFRNVAKSSDERTKGFLWGIDPKAEPTLRDQDAKARQAELDRQSGRTMASTSAQPTTSKPPLPPPKPAFTKEPLKSSIVYKPTLNGALSAVAKLPKASIANGTPSRIPAAAAAGGASVTLQLTPAHAFAATLTAVPKPASTPIPSTSTLPVSSTGKSSASLSSVVPQPATSVSLPIIIAPLPESYHSSAAAAALASSSASAILTTPPMVVHEGTLILNPTVFSHITPERLKELEQMGAQKALETLQVDVVRFLKTKMRSEGGNRGRGRGKGRGRGGGLGNGRTSEKGPKQEDSTPGAETSDATTVQANGHHNAISPANEAAKTVNGQGQAAVDSTSEEPPKKKRKLKDETDASSMDIDVDIVGT
ncbi:hypothetical protein BU17DRAFT_73384 [Hysterangium stoloniferum]|nr:hypothetical protein BU17DRAFT_73384 [Hysterangium stoloniferum]